MWQCINPIAEVCGCFLFGGYVSDPAGVLLLSFGRGAANLRKAHQLTVVGADGLQF